MGVVILNEMKELDGEILRLPALPTAGRLRQAPPVLVGAPPNTLNRLSPPEAPSPRAKSNARSYCCAALVADELVALVQVRFAIAVLRPKP